METCTLAPIVEISDILLVIFSASGFKHKGVHVDDNFALLICNANVQ